MSPRPVVAFGAVTAGARKEAAAASTRGLGSVFFL